ncbi:MAG: hypothetical protein E7218_07150 [Anaerofustis stercorihominis]|nr:hypothetical protein [Anaerofustis stercorihominis]
MYKYSDKSDGDFSLHDCHAHKMSLDADILSFVFDDGFYVLPSHPANNTGDVFRTSLSELQLKILDMDIFGIGIYLFVPQNDGRIIREEWEPGNFIDAVNSGTFSLEFVTEYKSYRSRLYKCYVWFDTAPYHYECEIELQTDDILYLWNDHFGE